MQRYEKFSEIIKVTQGKRRYATMYYPNVEPRATDIYLIAKKNTRLDNLAFQYYNDPRLWIVIARANKLHNATIRVPVGIRIRIPFPLAPSRLNDEFINNQF